MKSKNAKNSEGLFKSIFMAYTILILHLLLLAGLGIVVIFFGGLVRYFLWVFIGGMALVALSGYLFYRRMKMQGRSLRDALRSPMFNGRAVEISFLGGMAELKVGPSQKKGAIEIANGDQPLQLEDPDTQRVRDIATLAQLLEKNLITPEEFASAKQKLFRS